MLRATAFSRGVVGLAGAYRNRTILVGDSTVADQASVSGNSSTVPTSAGSFVVSNGVATITPTASIGAKTGDYVNVANFGDRTWALDPMNNTLVKVTAYVASPYSFSFATTAPNGDYSAGYSATAWGCSNMSASCDFGTFQWLRLFNSRRWFLLGNYGQNGTLTTDHLAMMPKILAGPAFDEVVLSSGVNDIVTAAANTTAAQAGAVQAYQNLTGEGLTIPAKGIVPQLLSYGARILWLMPPVTDSAYTGAQYRTIAILNLRRALKEFALRYPSQICVIDVTADMINGTLSTGGAVANYVASADLHPLTTACIAFAKTEASNIANHYPVIDLSPVSVLEDSTTYSQPSALGPNILAHGMFDGTGGSLGTGGVTGTVSTGWTGQGSTGTVAATGQNARTSSGGNSANWGYCQDIVFSGTAPSWTIQSTNFVAQLVANTRYKIGFTVTAVGAQTGLNSISGAFVGGGGNWAGNLNFNQKLSAFNNGYPFSGGEVIELDADFYWPAGQTATITALNITAVYSGTATGHLQISNAYCRPYIDDPYLS